MVFSLMHSGQPEDFLLSGETPLRKDIPEGYLWNLGAVFPDTDSWERAFSDLEEEIGTFSSFQRDLFSAPARLLEFLRAEEKAGEKMGKIYAYATMKSHEDTALPLYQGMADRAGTLLASFGAALSFFRPEVLAAGRGRVEEFLAASSDLEVYRHSFEEILRMEGHVLSREEEELLARSQEVARTAETAFSLLTNADMTFPFILDEKGVETELSEERYFLLNRSKDRRVRKDSFTGLYGTYGRYRNVLGSLYSGSVKSDLFFSKARKYPSSLEASLHGDNIPAEVYSSVVSTVRKNLGALHDYMALRKKALSLEELHMYDLNVPLADEPEVSYTWEQAKEMVAEGLAPLGEEYLSVLKEGFASGWVDVYENRGKRKGAYSWGSYGTHPYVLLNFNGSLRDVFTVAHEMGHSLHTWFSHRDQPQVYADYTIFLAEVASTTNEALLLESLLDRASKEERIFLLNHYLDQVRTTVFRQTMFAEFERETHRLAEEGEALPAERLCAYWMDLNRDYHGPAMTVDREIEVEWGRIPHFYSAFYVYKYVTGFAAAAALSRALREEGEDARRCYLGFLSRGSSAWSLDILREAGVDMATSRPLEKTIENFREKTALLEKLLRE